LNDFNPELFVIEIAQKVAMDHKVSTNLNYE